VQKKIEKANQPNTACT